jgi:protein phosphatase
MADQRAPTEADVRLYAMTHPGRVRPNNEDNFIVCSFHKEIDVHFTSLPDTSRLVEGGEPLGFLAAVADGVGGAAAGEVASRESLETLARYAKTFIQTYLADEPGRDTTFLEQLRASLQASHERVLQEARQDRQGMATTLTMLMTRWPVAYVVQVGDSRCYVMRGGELFQISKDQTFAQQMVDAGADDTPSIRATWGNLLTSSMGGPVMKPDIGRVELMWHDIVLLCSDGLTAHVKDPQIQQILADARSARDACVALIDAALEGGGSDNITVVVAAAGSHLEA